VFRWEYVKESDCLQDLCMGGRIILKELAWEGVDWFYQDDDRNE
jgi:hypothetical protein